MGGDTTNKEVYWLGDSRKKARSFPDAARMDIGSELMRVQSGLQPRDWQPMPSVGAGVREIRTHREGEFRVLYVANMGIAVYVLHAFRKKTEATPKQDISLEKTRLAELRRN